MSQESDTALARHQGVRILINDEPFFAPDEVMTGAAIAALGAFPSNNQLFLETPEPEDDRPISPDDVVRLHAGMKFYDVPVGTFG
jgi:hypothetical protein